MTIRRGAAVAVALLATAGAWAPVTALAAELLEVPVRAGTHPTFERLVFDWPAATGYEVEREADRVRIRFERRGKFRLDRVGGHIGELVLDVAPLGEEGVELRISPGASVRAFDLEDNRIVVDVARLPDTPAAKPADEASEAATTPAQPDATAGAAAPDSSASPSPSGDLQAELYRRDLMIASLLQRIERLERGVGLAPEPAAGPAENGIAEAATASAAADTVSDTGDAAPEGHTRLFGSDPLAERALERTLTREGALLLAAGTFEVEPFFTFRHATTRAPVFVTNGDAVSVFIGEDRVERREMETGLALRLGLPFDSQLELTLPWVMVDQSTETAVGAVAGQADNGFGSGPGNLEVALAATLMRERGWLPDLILRARYEAGTGETADDGVALGGGFHTVGGSLVALARQDPMAFFASLSYDAVLEKNGVDPGDVFGFGVGGAVALSPRTSLQLGFTQQFVGDTELDGQEIGGSDETVAMLTLGASTLLGAGVLLDVGVDVGLTDDAPDYVARVSLPIRLPGSVF